MASDPQAALDKATDSLELNDESLPAYYAQAAAYARMDDYERAGRRWSRPRVASPTTSCRGRCLAISRCAGERSARRGATTGGRCSSTPGTPDCVKWSRGVGDRNFRRLAPFRHDAHRGLASSSRHARSACRRPRPVRSEPGPIPTAPRGSSTSCRWTRRATMPPARARAKPEGARSPRCSVRASPRAPARRRPAPPPARRRVAGKRDARRGSRRRQRTACASSDNLRGRLGHLGVADRSGRSDRGRSPRPGYAPRHGSNQRIVRRGAAAAGACRWRCSPAAPSPARAAEKSIWGPVDAVPGHGDAFDLYRRLGVDTFQVHLNFQTTAPTKPATPARSRATPPIAGPRASTARWPRGARTGIAVAIQVSRSPRWANGNRPPIWRPRSKAYADFLIAAAPPLPVGAPLDDLGRAQPGGRVSAPPPRTRRSAPARLRQVARRRLRGAQERLPAQHRDRRDDLHRQRRSRPTRPRGSGR